MNSALIRLVGAVFVAGTAVLIHKRTRKRASSMCNHDRHLRAFYRDCVRLPSATQEKLRRHRDANRRRIKAAFEAIDAPVPRRYIIQGSYAMDTIIQAPNNDYDIDDGIVFVEEELAGPRDGELSPRQVRKMVCDALYDTRFNRLPEMLKNCVRVYYNEGHHVDIPVFRERTRMFGDLYLEIASGDKWRRTNPEAVKDWYNTAVIEKSPDSNDGRQMRRITRYLKKFTKSRRSWRMPSGFIISKLVHDEYVPHSERDDMALFETMSAIHQCLRHDMEVENPVASGMLTKTDQDARMVEFRERLGWAIEKLAVLFDHECTEADSARVWDSIFGSSYFSDRLHN